MSELNCIIESFATEAKNQKPPKNKYINALSMAVSSNGFHPLSSNLLTPNNATIPVYTNQTSANT
ncbi:Uncharacterised protein [Streptococcus pneumoniae]|nr:Uncharacterised protein [Streptococcus pneumoniae]